jgi:hypothetical protein
MMEHTKLFENIIDDRICNKTSDDYERFILEMGLMGIDL